MTQIRCLLAPNPSAMTFRGTNTYIIGEGEVAVLDPGPDDPAHLAAILEATKGERITHILLSHDHKDHSMLVPGLKAATGAPLCGYDSPSSAIRPDIALQDGQILESTSWQLEAIHTPGHSDDHLCFAAGNICLTADHVMGWASTAIIPPRGRLRDYMESLAKLETRPWQRFLSGHGDPIEDPAKRLATLRAHRQAREASILRLLSQGPSTLDGIVNSLYARIAPGLRPAARHNVNAHVIALCETGQVQMQDDRLEMAQP
ncbi:MBL fold metallo-hydrolase [Falsirhodobacter deserti]|uniref:MBL fold metallo-hydrolase n=1 Tax=Falsirhodobacter deserti TaxID=1365611 RepID=UPI0013E38A22|nr:MBL fold metallo-hydrolase [Falsirhodobacter deserti]